MIDITEAKKIVQSELPEATIRKQAAYRDQFLFLVELPDEFPVLFAVNASTKAFSDFSPFDDGDPAEIQALFLDQA